LAFVPLPFRKIAEMSRGARGMERLGLSAQKIAVRQHGAIVHMPTVSWATRAILVAIA
jgi:hypothetical protein